jgi:hypothetical protein
MKMRGRGMRQGLREKEADRRKYERIGESNEREGPRDKQTDRQKEIERVG